VSAYKHPSNSYPVSRRLASRRLSPTACVRLPPPTFCRRYKLPHPNRIPAACHRPTSCVRSHHSAPGIGVLCCVSLSGMWVGAVLRIFVRHVGGCCIACLCWARDGGALVDSLVPMRLAYCPLACVDHACCRKAPALFPTALRRLFPAPFSLQH